MSIVSGQALMDMLAGDQIVESCRAMGAGCAAQMGNLMQVANIAAPDLNAREAGFKIADLSESKPEQGSYPGMSNMGFAV